MSRRLQPRKGCTPTRDNRHWNEFDGMSDNRLQSTNPLYLGIDLGTGGVRALAVSAAGEVVAASSAEFPSASQTKPNLPPGHHEQDAQDWWRATQQALASIVAAL